MGTWDLSWPTRPRPTPTPSLFAVSCTRGGETGETAPDLPVRDTEQVRPSHCHPSSLFISPTATVHLRPTPSPPPAAVTAKEAESLTSHELMTRIGYTGTDRLHGFLCKKGINVTRDFQRYETNVGYESNTKKGSWQPRSVQPA